MLWCRCSSCPLPLTGSGISPIKALIESGHLQADKRSDVRLYYGTRDAGGCWGHHCWWPAHLRLPVEASQAKEETGGRSAVVMCCPALIHQTSEMPQGTVAGGWGLWIGRSISETAVIEC
jgi:hypothetical protein